MGQKTGTRSSTAGLRWLYPPRTDPCSVKPVIFSNVRSSDRLRTEARVRERMLRCPGFAGFHQFDPVQCLPNEHANQPLVVCGRTSQNSCARWLVRVPICAGPSWKALKCTEASERDARLASEGRKACDKMRHSRATVGSILPLGRFHLRRRRKLRVSSRLIERREVGWASGRFSC